MSQDKDGKEKEVEFVEVTQSDIDAMPKEQQALWEHGEGVHIGFLKDLEEYGLEEAVRRARERGEGVQVPGEDLPEAT